MIPLQKQVNPSFLGRMMDKLDRFQRSPIGVDAWKKRVPASVKTFCGPHALQILPTELLLTIVDYLDEVSAVCLKSSDRYLRASLLQNFDSTILTPCAK